MLKLHHTTTLELDFLLGPLSPSGAASGHRRSSPEGVCVGVNPDLHLLNILVTL